MKGIYSRMKSYPGFVMNEVKQNGLRGIKRSIIAPSSILGQDVSRMVDRNVQMGTPVWEKDWDILLVLDACRVDLMSEICDEYEYLPDPEKVETIWSIGSMSRDWIERSFSTEFKQKIDHTAYVTGNCFTEKVDFESEPAILDEVWKHQWDENLSTIPARPITNRAIDTWRTKDNQLDQMIVHYMQPHVPFVNNPELGDYGDPADFGSGFADIWGRLGTDFDRDTVWEAYLDNLRYVMEDVSLLLDNVDAEKVVITADHGNAMGELGVYGHPPGVLLPSIRRVPWIETSGIDSGSYTPTTDSVEKRTGVTSSEIEERLSHLGYK